MTLKNLVAEVKALGISKSLFILDHGFYSENNIKEMSDANIDFIIPLPFSVNVGKGLISETNREIHVSSVKPTIPLCISFYSHAGRVLH